MIPGGDERLTAVRGVDDRVAMAPEHLARHRAHLRLIFDQENSLGAGERTRRVRGHLGKVRHLLHPRQEDLERCTVAGFAIDEY